MNYYPFHMGDYSVHTGHLDLLEDLAYRRCLDFYYLHESPLPKDVTKLAKLIRMPDHAAVVRDVLNEFFIQEDDCWRHLRCDEELAKMKEKRVKAQASAQASVNARRTNAQRTLNERSAKVELPIPTPIPIPKDKTNIQAPEGVSDLVWKDFVAFRKSRKAPITQLVIDGLAKQAKLANWSLEDVLKECVVRGWQSFKAEWVAGKQTVSPKNSYDFLMGGS